MVRFLAPILLLAACSAPRPPNVLYIIADDLGWADVGFNNPETFYRTPVLDALAASGTRFERAYATAPVSSPSRVTLLTGLHPVDVGVTDFTGGRTAERVITRPNYPHPLVPARFRNRVELEVATVGEHFREAGYRTMFAGKWHLGPRGYWPQDQGFDINQGGGENGAPLPPGRYFPPYGNPQLSDGPEGEHLPARLAGEVARFVESGGDRPFLAVLSFYSVHTPLMAPDSMVARWQKLAESAPPDSFGVEGSRRVRLVQNHPVYAAMVEAMDRAIGDVLAVLPSTGHADNTIVVFVSDHGGLSTSEGHPTSNTPLRAGKGWLYEGGLRVPMVLHVPGVPATTRTDPVSTMDIVPTLLDAAGLDVPARLEGASLLKEAATERSLYWHYPHYSHQGGPPVSAILQPPHKLLEYYETGHLELYHIGADPREDSNLAETDTATTKVLRDALNEYLGTRGAAYPRLHPTNGATLETVHPRVTPFTIPGLRQNQP